MSKKQRRQLQLSVLFSACQEHTLLGISTGRQGEFIPCLVMGHIMDDTGEIFQFGQMETGEFIVPQDQIIVVGDVQQNTGVQD